MTEWSADELAALRKAFGDGLNAQTLDEALLTPDERDALHSALAEMARQRRRAEAELANWPLP